MSTDLFLSTLSLRNVLTALTGVTVIVLLKRLVFHPLARFPGPKLAAATWWYMTYYEVFKDGAFVDHLEELHKKYGASCSYLTAGAHLLQLLQGPSSELAQTRCVVSQPTRRTFYLSADGDHSCTSTL